MKKQIRNLTAFLAMSSLLIVGCSDDDDDNPTNPSLEKANVMVVHASPDAPGVDLFVDDEIAGENLKFPNNTGYLQVDEGSRNVKVNVSGTSSTVIEADLTLEGNINYSVFAADVVTELTPLVIIDDLSIPEAGNSHVRFIHLSPDAPAVDITTTDGSVIFGNSSFKDYTDFMPVPAGSYDLQVRLSGTDTVVLELSDINLMDGSIYTVFAKGLVSGMGTEALGAEIIVNN